MIEEEVLRRVKELIFCKNIVYIKQIQGGMSNENHLIDVDGMKMIYRVPRDIDGLFVLYEDEYINTKLRDSFSFIPKVKVNSEKGERLSKYIDGERLGSDDLYHLRQSGKQLALFHQTAPLAKNNYSPFERLLRYEALIDEYLFKNSTYFEVRAYLFEQRELLENTVHVHCHNDFQLNNIIVNDEDIFFLDWEFAGNNDPMYDIACMYMSAGRDCAMHVLTGYSQLVTEEEKERVYKWTLFQYVQWANVAYYKGVKSEYDHFGYDFKQLSLFFIEQAKMIYENEIKKV